MTYLKDLLSRTVDAWLRPRWLWTLYSIAGFTMATLVPMPTRDAVGIAVCATAGAVLAVTGPAIADSLRENRE